MAKTFSTTTLATLAASGSTASIALESLESEVTVYLGAGGATFGAGTLTLQESFDGGTTWLAHPTASWTSGTAGAFLGKAIVHAPLVRLTLAGATSPTIIPTVKVATVRGAQNNASASLNGASQPITFTANGTSNTFQISGLSVAGNTTVVNGDTQLPWAAQGTFGGGTLALQGSPDGVNWFQYDTATANVKKLTKPVTDMLFRFVLTGATSPNLSVWVVN